MQHIRQILNSIPSQFPEILFTECIFRCQNSLAKKLIQVYPERAELLPFAFVKYKYNKFVLRDMTEYISQNDMGIRLHAMCEFYTTMQINIHNSAPFQLHRYFLSCIRPYVHKIITRFINEDFVDLETKRLCQILGIAPGVLPTTYVPPKYGQFAELKTRSVDIKSIEELPEYWGNISVESLINYEYAIHIANNENILIPFFVAKYIENVWKLRGICVKFVARTFPANKRDDILYNFRDV